MDTMLNNFSEPIDFVHARGSGGASKFKRVVKVGHSFAPEAHNPVNAAFALLNIGARPARAMMRIFATFHQIFASQQMASGTMGFSQVKSAATLAIFESVHPRRNGAQMIGIDANLIAADMINVQGRVYTFIGQHKTPAM